MKGAAGPAESAISTPMKPRASTIGRSHHFLFTLRNSQISPSALGRRSSVARRSNSLGEGSGISYNIADTLPLDDHPTCEKPSEPAALAAQMPARRRRDARLGGRGVAGLR